MSPVLTPHPPSSPHVPHPDPVSPPPRWWQVSRVLTVRSTSMSATPTRATTGPARTASLPSPASASPATRATAATSTSTSARASPAKMEGPARTGTTPTTASASKGPRVSGRNPPGAPHRSAVPVRHPIPIPILRRVGPGPPPSASPVPGPAWGVFDEGEFSRFGAWLSAGTAPQPGAGEPLVVEALCCGVPAAVSASGLRFASSAGPGTPLTAPLSSPGPNCEINLDDCASNPCDYGKCIDKINGYECTCETGYTGESRTWWLPWHPGDLVRIQPGAGEPWGVPCGRGSAGMPAAGGAPRSPGRGCGKEGRRCHPARRRFCTLQCSCLFRRVTLAQAEIKGVSSAANSTPAAPTPMGIGLLPCPTGLFDRCWKWRRALMGAAPTSPHSRGPLSSARREPQ